MQPPVRHIDTEDEASDEAAFDQAVAILEHGPDSARADARRALAEIFHRADLLDEAEQLRRDDITQPELFGYLWKYRDHLRLQRMRRLGYEPLPPASPCAGWSSYDGVERSVPCTRCGYIQRERLAWCIGCVAWRGGERRVERRDVAELARLLLARPGQWMAGVKTRLRNRRR